MAFENETDLIEAKNRIAELTCELKEQHDGISRVWTALGITKYTGKPIWEHVTELTAELAAARAECEDIRNQRNQALAVCWVVAEYRYGRITIEDVYDTYDNVFKDKEETK